MSPHSLLDNIAYLDIAGMSEPSCDRGLFVFLVQCVSVCGLCVQDLEDQMDRDYAEYTQRVTKKNENTASAMEPSRFSFLRNFVDILN